MKKFWFVLLLLCISTPAPAEVLVYNWIENKTGLESDGGIWEQFTEKPLGYNVLEVGSDEVTVWSIETWKGKDKNGKKQNYCRLDFVESYELIRSEIAGKQIWLIPAAGKNWRMLLTGQAKPNKTTGTTIPSKLDGFAIVDEADFTDREIRNVKITFKLNTKLTLSCQGRTAEQAKDYVLASLTGKGYLDCDANPCLCNGEWKSEPSMNIARDQFTGGVINGKIYVFGGNGNPNQVNLKSTEMYDPLTQVWTMKADNEHNGGWGVEELTSAVMNGKLYVFGAWGGNGVINFNEEYNPVTNTWKTLASKPTQVAAAPATIYNGEIYLFGGFYEDDSENQTHYNVVEAYNPSANSWRTVTNMPVTMMGFAVAAAGTKAYIFGGATGTEQNFQVRDDIITYDFETCQWQTTGYSKLPVKKGFVFSNAAPVIDGKIFLIGGMELSGSKLVMGKRVDIYNPATDSWEKGGPLPLPWDDFVSVVLGSKIYVIGGDHEPSSANRARSDVISFDTQACLP